MLHPVCRGLAPLKSDFELTLRKGLLKNPSSDTDLLNGRAPTSTLPFNRFPRMRPSPKPGKVTASITPSDWRHKISRSRPYIRLSGVRILSNLVIVSEQLVDAYSELLAGGYSEEDATKTAEATGFKSLSRFTDTSLDQFISMNADVMRDSVGRNLGKVKLLLVVTQTNLRKIPNAASRLQSALGLGEDVFCLEIVDGCNGFVKALHTAHRLLQENEIGLIFSGEMNSVMVSGAPAGTSALFGDGFALTQVVNTGKFSSKIRQSGARGNAIRFGGNDLSLHMDGFEVFAFSTREVPKLFDSGFAGGFGENRFPVFHQASKLVVEQVAKRVGYSDHHRPVFAAGSIGNIGPGSIPSWLAQQNSLSQGIEIVCVGFGSGLSWGYATISWDARRNELLHV